MADGKGARDESTTDTSPQADEKPMDPTDDAGREPTRPVGPTSAENNPNDKDTPTGVQATAAANENEASDGQGAEDKK